MVTNHMEVSIVIPAHRAALNLSVLIPRLAAVLRRVGLEAEMIVIDEFSDDGTETVCASLSQSYPVRLITHRGESVPGAAVILGLQQACGEILVVMNADMSHPPQMVPRLVLACRAPLVDFVIGSRYVEGSTIGATYSLYYRLNSRLASLMTRGLTSASDPLSGFFAIKQSTLRTANKLKPVSHDIGLEIIVRCGCCGIVEIPISFRDPVFGQRSLTVAHNRRFVQKIIRLYAVRYAAPAQLICFGVIGTSGAIVDLTVFTLMLRCMPLSISRIAAIACATLWNFAWNRQITFRSASAAPFVHRLVKYFGATLLGAAINCSVTVALCASLQIFTTAPTLAAAIGAVAGAAANFVLCRRWVFHNRETTNAVAESAQTSGESATFRRVA
jgi:dolichol-phosphate mannosyltransferase